MYTAFVAFCASVATLLAVGMLAPDAPDDVPQEPARYTLEDVARHAGEDSCWIAVEGRVYDVTGYLPLHPTSPTVLLEWCGSEATKGMRTKGYGRDHSPGAWAALAEYEIGALTR
ncbi:MAG: cytochrome b5 domain-containing protein [Gammaproteobacteria bacterium]|nr:cytochrome b5 domain-containing protein [Gammaproteobacteria bacterium]